MVVADLEGRTENTPFLFSNMLTFYILLKDLRLSLSDMNLLCMWHLEAACGRGGRQGH